MSSRIISKKERVFDWVNTLLMLIVIVQVFQSFGNWATKRSDRRIS